MLLSKAIGGNLLGWIDAKEAKIEKLGFQTFWRIGCNSVSDGEGPQRAHTITPFINSAVTSRNGTWNLKNYNINRIYAQKIFKKQFESI